MYAVIEKCAFLAQRKNVVVIGSHEDRFDEPLAMFAKCFGYPYREDIKERLEAIFIKHPVELVVIFASGSERLALEILQWIEAFEESVATLVVVDRLKEESVSLMDRADLVCSTRVDRRAFYLKLFMLLNRKCIDSTPLQGTLLALNDTLFSLHRRFASGELSVALLQKSVNVLRNVEEICLKNGYLSDNEIRLRKVQDWIERLMSRNLRDELESFDRLEALLYDLGLYLKYAVILDAPQLAMEYEERVARRTKEIESFYDKSFRD